MNHPDVEQREDLLFGLMADYDEALANGVLPATPDARVRVNWAPLAMTVLLLPAIAVVVLSLT